MGLGFNWNNNTRPFIDPHPPSLVRVFNSFDISDFLLEKKSSFTITDHTFDYVHSIPLINAEKNQGHVQGGRRNFWNASNFIEGWVGSF